MRRTFLTTATLLALIHVGAASAQSVPAPGDGMEQAEAGDTPVDDAGAAPGGVVLAPASGEDVKGDAFYCRERKLGTWFYCERRKRPSSSPASPPAPSGSATAQLAAITQRLDELKARAVIEPTEANVTAYIRYQREQLDRASMFSDVWQRAVWQDPSLDYTLQRPVSSLGKRAWLDNRKAEEEATLRHLSQRYGIFYFYAQSCGACEVFAPILKAVSDKGGFDVVAVSMDGGPNRVFPRYVVDTGQYARMGLTSRATPALVLYDTVTRRPVPIGTGILSADEITERIFVLTNTRPGSGF